MSAAGGKVTSIGDLIEKAYENSGFSNRTDFVKSLGYKNRQTLRDWRDTQKMPVQTLKKLSNLAEVELCDAVNLIIDSKKSPAA